MIRVGIVTASTRPRRGGHLVEKTIDLDGTVHADAADVADVGRMHAGLAARSSSGSTAAGR